MLTGGWDSPLCREWLLDQLLRKAENRRTSGCSSGGRDVGIREFSLGGAASATEPGARAVERGPEKRWAPVQFIPPHKLVDTEWFETTADARQVRWSFKDGQLTLTYPDGSEQ